MNMFKRGRLYFILSLNFKKHKNLCRSFPNYIRGVGEPRDRQSRVFPLLFSEKRPLGVLHRYFWHVHSQSVVRDLNPLTRARDSHFYRNKQIFVLGIITLSYVQPLWLVDKSLSTWAHMQHLAPIPYRDSHTASCILSSR